jgi:hypothetical protein
MLTVIEGAVLKAKGYEFKGTLTIRPGQVVAFAEKNGARAEHLGRNPIDASQKLVRMLARP